MQTPNAVVVTLTHYQLRMEATELLRRNGLSADGRPLLEARIARHVDAIGNRKLKWKPPKKRR